LFEPTGKARNDPEAAARFASKALARLVASHRLSCPELVMFNPTSDVDRILGAIAASIWRPKVYVVNQADVGGKPLAWKSTLEGLGYLAVPGLRGPRIYLRGDLVAALPTLARPLGPDEPFREAEWGTEIHLPQTSADLSRNSHQLTAIFDAWLRERNMFQSERDAWQRERDAWQRERDARQSERDAWQRERVASTARIDQGLSNSGPLGGWGCLGTALYRRLRRFNRRRKAFGAWLFPSRLKFRWTRGGPVSGPRPAPPEMSIPPLVTRPKFSAARQQRIESAHLAYGKSSRRYA